VTPLRVIVFDSTHVIMNGWCTYSIRFLHQERILRDLIMARTSVSLVARRPLLAVISGRSYRQARRRPSTQAPDRFLLLSTNRRAMQKIMEEKHAIRVQIFQDHWRPIAQIGYLSQIGRTSGAGRRPVQFIPAAHLRGGLRSAGQP
jgi:hypothetical protein